MFPEDRVLVGVVNRKRDLAYALNEHWYRIPQARLPRGFDAEYLALFCSAGILKGKPGGIYYFAQPQGVELARRRDLLPKEANHERADHVYYRISLTPLKEKKPPVLNPTGRSIYFIYTTWDRFGDAETIRDLYSDDDYYVDRIYHALRERNVYAERDWDAAKAKTGVPAGMRILCENGMVTASMEDGRGIFMDATQPDDTILREIFAAIAREGGPVMVSLPGE
jgi:hypothetical protein